jgi:SAM-dependent methyltransferase
MTALRPEGFDSFANNYESALAKGLSVSGEGRDYFARGRVSFLRESASNLGGNRRTLLDFGCGTGDTVPILDAEFAPDRIIGVDPSKASLKLARSRFSSERYEFRSLDEWRITAEVDLAYVNGVFHHIPPGDRQALMTTLASALRRGGILSFWENNPWNPGTRIVMRRIPFDRTALPMSALEGVRLAKRAGLNILRVDFLFIFPRALAMLRRLERPMSRLPLGAQYQILCRRP